MKKLLSYVFALLLVVGTAQPLSKAAEGQEINVLVNDTAAIWTDARPFINSDGRTMVPLRAVGDALGLTADWDATTREAIFSKGDNVIRFPIDSSVAKTSEGNDIIMDTAAVIVDDRTYAPVRYLAEYFGYYVGWDDSSRTVIISASQIPHQPVVDKSKYVFSMSEQDILSAINAGKADYYTVQNRINAYNLKDYIQSESSYFELNNVSVTLITPYSRIVQRSNLSYSGFNELSFATATEIYNEFLKDKLILFEIRGGEYTYSTSSEFSVASFQNGKQLSKATMTAGFPYRSASWPNAPAYYRVGELGIMQDAIDITQPIQIVVRYLTGDECTYSINLRDFAS